jgi:alkanesulfonate monooxygenase SsuD/methylene tetrahydromethanopterin reductase-like flavin-dependent oxidoreductase (luciferase family)
LGIDSVWFSEHHGFEDGYLPQPLTFAAAIAARTSRMRIGTAIMLGPLRPALDVAEQAAIVDIVSEGRLELGLGTGYRASEYRAYERDIEGRYPKLEALVREIRRLWEEGDCTPPPIQDPPPVWIGAIGPRAARMAGRLGEGLLWLSSALLEPYRTGLEEGGHDPSSARMAGLANLIVADDPRQPGHGSPRTSHISATHTTATAPRAIGCPARWTRVGSRSTRSRCGELSPRRCRPPSMWSHRTMRSSA